MPRERRRARGSQGREVRPRRIRRFLEPAVLMVLHAGPSHGYAIAESLSQLGLHNYPADVGGVYRVLYDLERQGMLVSSEDAASSGGPPRKVYRLTEAGDQHLSDWVTDLRETDLLLHRFLQAYETHLAAHAHQPEQEATRHEGRADQGAPLS